MARIVTDSITRLTTTNMHKMSTDEIVTSWTTNTPADVISKSIIVSEGDITEMSFSSSKATTTWTTIGDEVTFDGDFDALNVSMTMALFPTIIYIAVLMLVGLVGNSVVFLVYYRRFKPSATRSYVMAMSVIDLLANALSLPSEILDIRFFFTFDLPWLCKTARFGNSFLALVSAFILVAVARDRFRKICHPLDKQRSMLRIKVYILLCCAGSFALTVPFAVLNGSHAIPTGISNVTGVTCSVDDVYVDTLFPLVYSVVMALVFIACVVVMAMSYTCIARELWRHKRKIAREPESLRRAAAASAKSKDAKGSSLVEDTSSGPRHDLESSEGKTESTCVELVPLTSLRHQSRDTKTSSTKAQSKALVDFSDKDVLLLSMKNFTHERPKSSSVEDSDEGCFSASSAEVTSSDNAWREETASTACACPEESGLKNNEEEPHADCENTKERTARNKQSDSDIILETLEQCKSGEPSSKDNVKAGEDSELEGNEAKTELTSALVEDVKNKDHGDLPHKADPCELEAFKNSTLQQHNTAKSTSLLQAVLKSRGRHYDINNRPKGATKPKTPKKRRGASVRKIPSSTTFMMFILTAIFVVNYLPHLIIISLRAVSDDLQKGLTGWTLNAYNIGLRSYFMNCAVNSLVYGFCSARFRQECRALCGRRR